MLPCNFADGRREMFDTDSRIRVAALCRRDSDVALVTFDIGGQFPNSHLQTKMFAKSIENTNTNVYSVSMFNNTERW
jgi:hypothetical protein